MNLLNQIIPKQKKGLQTGATSHIAFDSRHTAVTVFNRAKERLTDINNWYHLCGDKGAEFQLTDAEGNPLNNVKPKVDDLIRIKLPAPPNPEGEGYDWVRIEKFEEDKDLMKDEEIFGMRVRPVDNPKNNNPESAHFYTDDATSTFVVLRRTHIVYAMERGKNEVPNANGSLLNKIRNLLVAIPAMLGLSKPQWKSLTDGLLK